MNLEVGVWQAGYVPETQIKHVFWFQVNTWKERLIFLRRKEEHVDLIYTSDW